MTHDPEAELFQACLDAASAVERERLLESVPDAAMRVRIRRLLDAHEEAPDSFMADFGELPRLAMPDRIGPYRILERLGEGAMGDVWLAEQLQPVRRRVGLKILKFGLSTREVIARFELERQTLALMTHPNIARILDAGATEDGRPYFAMEYVPGISIARYCDERRLDLTARLALFAEVCGGVQHAHLRGIIHRDLKPSNVLVTELDGRPVPKIIDFGIAKATTIAAAGETAAHTRFGHLLGTPEYMSPEQAQLSPLDIDVRTDVYSLGVLLYELVTGARPYRLTSDAPDPAVVAREIADREAVRPSERAVDGADAVQRARVRGHTPKSLAARLAGDLDWIILKALEKDRQRRYASPAELAADLARHANHDAVLAGPPSVIYRIRKFTRRHRLAVAALGSLFVAAIAFGSGMAWLATQAAHERDRANHEAEVARRVTAFTAGLFELASPVSGGLPAATARELLDRGVRRLAAQRDTESDEVRAALLEAAGNAYRGLGVYAEAERLLVDATALRREHAWDQPAPYAQSLLNQALVKRDQGDLARAETLARDAVAALPGSSVPQVAARERAHLELAEILRRRSKLDEAEPFAAAVLAHYESAGAAAQDRAHAMLILGRIRSASGRLPEAASLLATALELQRRSGAGLDELAVETKAGLADTLVVMGRSADAEPLLRELVADARALYGDAHPNVGMAWNDLGNALSDDPTKFDEAEIAYTNARDLLRASLGDAHHEVATTFNNLGALYLKTKEWAKADAAHHEALRIRLTALGEDHPDTAASKLGRALALNKLERFAEAEALLRDALRVFAANLGADHWRTANAQLYLGMVLTNLRRFPEAEREIETARSILERTLGADHWRTQQTDKALAELEAARRASRTAR